MPAISFGIVNGRVHLILRCISINSGFRLHNEFPELIAATKADAGPISIAEVGCGMAFSPVDHPAHFFTTHFRCWKFGFSSTHCESESRPTPSCIRLFTPRREVGAGKLNILKTTSPPHPPYLAQSLVFVSSTRNDPRFSMGRDISGWPSIRCYSLDRGYRDLGVCDECSPS